MRGARRSALGTATPAQVRRWVTDGTWQSPWPGVYADAGHLLDAEQRAFAAVLAGGGATRTTTAGRRAVRTVACGRTAARVHGLLLVDDDDPATGAQQCRWDEVAGWTHARSRRATDDRVQRHRELVLRQGDVLRTSSGLWLTSLPRTLLDCAGVLAPEAVVCLLDDLLHRAMVRRAELDALLNARAGQPGAGALRQAVRLSDGRAESPTESLTRLLLGPVLAGVEPQVELRSVEGRLLARFDLGVRRRRLAVELDGRRGHAGEAMVARDQRRDRIAAAHGWATERATWYDVRCRQAEFVARVLERRA